MRNQTTVPAATFKALFAEWISAPFFYALLKRCGVRRRGPPVVTAWELIQGLIFHVVAEAGTLAQHVKQLTGKNITDGDLSQRRALLPIAGFEALLTTTLQPKAERARHPRGVGGGGRRSRRWASRCCWNWACPTRWRRLWGRRGNRGPARLRPVSAKPHPFDGPARTRRADPRLCGLGGLPGGRRGGGRSGRAADQFRENAPRRARLVAIPHARRGSPHTVAQVRLLVGRGLRRIAAMAIPKRRQRSCPRALRQPVSRWPRLRKHTYRKGAITYAIGAIYA